MLEYDCSMQKLCELFSDAGVMLINVKSWKAKTLLLKSASVDLLPLVAFSHWGLSWKLSSTEKGIGYICVHLKQ